MQDVGILEVGGGGTAREEQINPISEQSVREQWDEPEGQHGRSGVPDLDFSTEFYSFAGEFFHVYLSHREETWKGKLSIEPMLKCCVLIYNHRRLT